jgi:hypothetical protein
MLPLSITAEDVEVCVMSTLHRLADSHLILRKEVLRHNALTGGFISVPAFEVAAKGALRLSFTKLLSSIMTIAEVNDIPLADIPVSVSWCSLGSEGALLSSNQAFISMLRDLRNSDTSNKLMLKTIGFIERLYPFQQVANEINELIKSKYLERLCNQILTLMPASKADVKQRGVIFKESLYGNYETRTLREFEQLSQSLVAVSAECDFQFGNALSEFLNDYQSGIYPVGQNYGARGSQHIKINTFQKHIRMTISHDAFDCITAFLVANGNESIQDKAFELLQLIAD